MNGSWTIRSTGHSSSSSAAAASSTAFLSLGYDDARTKKSVHYRSKYNYSEFISF